VSTLTVTAVSSLVLVESLFATGASFTELMFTLTLANGQVWREVEGSPVPHWRDPASRYTVSITKGSLDSYNLIIEGEGVQYKAKRLH